MLPRCSNRLFCLALACIVLPNLGTSCPSTLPLDPNDPNSAGVSVAGTYTGTVSNTTTTLTQLPRSGSSTTTGTGTFTLTVGAYGKPTAVQIGFDNHGSPVSTFVIDYASMTTGQTTPFPTGSTSDGWSQTGGITAKEVTFSGTGFHIVVEDNGALTYTSGSQAGITIGGLTTSTFDGKISGDVLTYTELVASHQTTQQYGATTGSSETTIHVTGSLAKQ
ncbi:MAG TPA: hypothetical protein VMV94_08350 [Phycisphaerae bacterium]|nr:hypothetical protein [Phycisphaerae bacterium]